MWSSKDKDLEHSTEVWNDETGETVAEAFARFSTFGPVMNVAEAIRYLKANPSVDMMSFGYGDDPEDFDSIGLEELEEAVAEDGVSEVNDTWRPFAPWLN